MTRDDIKTGADLRQYVLQLIKIKQEETQLLQKNDCWSILRIHRHSAFPKLENYLLSLWAVAEKYRNVDRVRFKLIAQILEEAFDAPPKEMNWKEEVKNPFTAPFSGEPNSPEYFAEMKTYSYFNKTLRNYVVSLHLLIKHGARSLGITSDDTIWSDKLYVWKNKTTETFLEIGTSFLEDQVDRDDNSTDFPVSWIDLCDVLSHGRYDAFDQKKYGSYFHSENIINIQHMTRDDIKTGADLRKYVLQLIDLKLKETELLQNNDPLNRLRKNKRSAFPPLHTYLLSFWNVAEKYRNVDKVKFKLIAQILEEAFDAPPKQINWEEEVKTPFIPPFTGEPNSPEYFAEIKTYDYFNKSIRNGVVSLHLLIQYGPKRLGVGPYDNIFTGNNYFWENTTTEAFLERGTAFLEDETEWTDYTPDFSVDWFELCSILRNGRFEE